jgi:hypothetical protein
MRRCSPSVNCCLMLYKSEDSIEFKVVSQSVGQRVLPDTRLWWMATHADSRVLMITLYYQHINSILSSSSIYQNEFVGPYPSQFQTMFQAKKLGQLSYNSKFQYNTPMPRFVNASCRLRNSRTHLVAPFGMHISIRQVFSGYAHWLFGYVGLFRPGLK